MIRDMLSQKIKLKMGKDKSSPTESLFVYVGKNMPNGCNFLIYIF